MLSKDTDHYIGMICNVGATPKLEKRLAPWIHRALVINQELEKHETLLFCYNPNEINPKTKTVPGYILNNNEFQRIILPIPPLNYKTSYYMGLFKETIVDSLPFAPWAVNKGFEFYPSNSIDRLVSDKLTTAQIISEYNFKIQPETDLFSWKPQQLKQYIDKYQRIFIKPRFGGWGDDIFVVKKENNLYHVNYYWEGETHSKSFQALTECLAYLDKKSQSEQYVIQQGIEVLRYKGSVFDVRSVVVKDGETSWFFVSQVRLGAQSKDVSNISQGGQDFNTERFLAELLPKKTAQDILKRIENISKGIASFLVNHHHKVEELAIDIMVDKSGKLHIAELNTDPILLGSPKNFRDFFNMTEEEEHLYETTSIKHGEYLAKSMLKKMNSTIRH